MTQPVLIVDRPFDGCAVLTLNRPEVMNALSAELRRVLAETVAELEADPGVRVLVLTGAGRAFCAGLDLKEGALDELLKVDTEGWKAELESIKEYYATFEGKLPKEMYDQLDALEKRLQG